MTLPVDTELNRWLQELRIPPDISRLAEIKQPGRVQELIIWKDSVVSSFQTLVPLIRREHTLSDANQADITMTILPFFPSICQVDTKSCAWLRNSVDAWDIPHLGIVADELNSLDFLLNPSREVVTTVLVEKLRPVFKTSQHPYLHAETARKLPRATGGHMAMQDFYEAQEWKQHPGISHVVLWCIHATEPDSFEQIWHLLIPPVMAFLDDYEVKSKLQGMILVQEMVKRIPKSLMHRTGIEVLLRQSLRNALSHLESPDSPSLVYLAIRTSLDLILLMTSPGSADRFDDLSSLLGEGVIAGIWLYSEDKPAIIKATFDALPHLIQALGIGTTRFLQAIIPQLAFTLIPKHFSSTNPPLLLSAMRIFDALFESCSSRMPHWKQTILDAVGRCWVGIHDLSPGSNSDVQDHSSSEVQSALQELCANLAKVCPSVLQEEYPAFIAADESLFRDLFLKVSLPEPTASGTT